MATRRNHQTADSGMLNLNAELAGNFGDRRLQRRAAAIAAAWVHGGNSSFPDMHGDTGAEGLYRLVNNDKFDFTTALDAHVQHTARRAAEVEGLVVVAHDTTDFAVPLHDPADVREHFGIKSSRTQGFELHVSKAFAFDRQNTPLGVLEVKPFVHAKHLSDGHNRPNGDAARQYWWEHDGLYENEQQRWVDAVAASSFALGDKAAHAVHVMDREADDYAMLAWMVHRDHRFVQRANTARR